MLQIIGSSITYFSNMSLPFMLFFILVNAYFVIFNKNHVVTFLGLIFNFIILVDMITESSSILDYFIIAFIIFIVFLKLVTDIDF